MITGNELRQGVIINLDGNLFSVLEFQHTKPGKGGALIKTKLRSIETGLSVEKTFRAGERVEKVSLEKRPAQYLYSDGESHIFMDTKTYEQYTLDGKLVEKSRDFLKDNLTVNLYFYKDKPLQVELPVFVELKVTHCNPGLKGDTVSSTTKPAVLETEFSINVPLFINIGDMIKIDTRTGEYVERI